MTNLTPGARELKVYLASWQARHRAFGASVIERRLLA
jgi:hypothetical protein